MIKLLRAMKPISISDNLETYLQSMERTLDICEVPKQRYIDFLRTNMTGKYAMSLETVDAVNATYSQVKAKLLAAAGLTVAKAGRRINRPDRKKIEKKSGIELWQYGKRLLRRILSGVSTLEEAIGKLGTTWIKNTVSRNCSRFLNCRDIRTEDDTIEALQNFDSMEGSQPEERSRIASKLPQRCFECGKQGHKAADCWSKTGVGAAQQKKHAELSVTCFKCGEKGHKSPDCPQETKGKKKNKAEQNRVRRLSLENTSDHKPCTTTPIMDGKEIKVLLDMGARISLIAAQDIKTECKYGKWVWVVVKDINGHEKLRETAVVRIEVKGREWERRVVLVPQKELGREAILSIAPLKEEELKSLVEVARGNTKKVAMVETRS